jgi:hypothetical protein
MALFEAIVKDFKGDFSLIRFVTHTESAFDVLCRGKPPCLPFLGSSMRGRPTNSVETAPRTELARLRSYSFIYARA